jgi:hypothetical protein
MRYARDDRTGALFLRDRQAIRQFTEKQELQDEIRILKSEINSLKIAVDSIKARLETPEESK